jgi:16S rRNA (cytidine1402-2'-O)-methyltransferase
MAPAQVGPGLYIVSTPIGNLRDITLRAIDTLNAVDEVLAEDTRTARKLFDAYAVKTKLTAYHDHNGAARRPELLSRLEGGAKLALISDAGTPLVSDPGWKLVHEASMIGLNIVPVPGASAMLAGLVKSGLPSDRFLFAGFLPAKRSARQKALNELVQTPATLIFYESGPRLIASLADMRDVLGSGRRASVTRELTKLFEEARSGTLTELAAHYETEGKPKGEIVVLVGPPEPDIAPTQDILEAALKTALETQPTKAAANQVAAQYNLPKREVYQLALDLKSDGQS